MTDFPSPWVFVLMALFATRAVHLLLWDAIIGTHPDSETDLAAKIQGWGWDANKTPRSWWRGRLAYLLTCPMCSGFWLSLATVCVASWLAPWSLGNIGWITVGAVWCVQCVLSVLDYKFIVD